MIELNANYIEFIFFDFRLISNGEIRHRFRFLFFELSSSGSSPKNLRKLLAFAF